MSAAVADLTSYRVTRILIAAGVRPDLAAVFAGEEKLMSAVPPERASIGVALDVALSAHALALEEHADRLERIETRLAQAERGVAAHVDRIAQLAATLAGQSVDLADFQNCLALLQRRL